MRKAIAFALTFVPYKGSTALSCKFPACQLRRQSATNFFSSTLHTSFQTPTTLCLSPLRKPQAFPYIMSNSASSSLVISKSPNQLAASISRDVSSCRQEEEQSVVSILPFEEASHKSIKIIVPEKKKNNGKDSAYDSPEIFRRRVEATILTCRKLGKNFAVDRGSDVPRKCN